MGSALPGDHLGKAIDRTAAGFLCAAVGWAVFASLDREPAELQWAAAAAGGAASLWAAFLLLRRLSGEQYFPMPEFDLADFNFVEPEDGGARNAAESALVLELPGEEGELLLDDAVHPVSDQSQVIRLFDPAHMPTAGELQDRVDRHLAHSPRAVPDSTQELYAALSALRQTLR